MVPKFLLIQNPRTESCFTNPFPYKPDDLKPITLDNYEKFAAQQDKPNFNNDPNCEDVLQPYNVSIIHEPIRWWLFERGLNFLLGMVQIRKCQ